MSGCSPKDDIQIDDSNLPEYSEKDKIVEDFKNKYAAVELDNECGNISFSAEIVDKCKEKNIYATIVRIDDVFYSDEELYMYAETWGNEKFLLKITQEQYSVIQSLHSDYLDYILHIIFTIDNIEPMFPTLSADFYFDISGSDGILDDECASVSFDSQIIRGPLVDIIEVRN